MIEIIILIFILSYREVGILCDRTSWRYEWFQKIFWETDQNNFWKKNFDWFHVSNGLMTLIICHLFAQSYQLFGRVYLDVPFYWVIWMYLRNVVMHVLIPLPSYRRYWFLVPLVGAYLEKKFL